jgi:hypothetical protein
MWAEKTAHVSIWGADLRTLWIRLKVKDYQAPFIAQLVILTLMSAMFVHTSRTCCRGNFEEAVSSKSQANSILLPNEVLVFHSNEYGMTFQLTFISINCIRFPKLPSCDNMHAHRHHTIPCRHTACVPFHFLHQQRQLLIMHSSSCCLILQLIVVVYPDFMQLHRNESNRF